MVITTQQPINRTLKCYIDLTFQNPTQLLWSRLRHYNLHMPNAENSNAKKSETLKKEHSDDRASILLSDQVT